MLHYQNLYWCKSPVLLALLGFFFLICFYCFQPVFYHPGIPRRIYRVLQWVFTVMFAVYTKSIVRFIFHGLLLGVLGRCVWWSLWCWRCLCEIAERRGGGDLRTAGRSFDHKLHSGSRWRAVCAVFAGQLQYGRLGLRSKMLLSNILNLKCPWNFIILGIATIISLCTLPGFSHFFYLVYRSENTKVEVAHYPLFCIFYCSNSLK